MCFPQFRGCRRGLGPAKNLLFASLQPLNSDSISVLSASCCTTAGTPMEKQHLIKYLSLAMPEPERSDAATQLPLGPTLHPGSLPGPQIGCRRLRRRWCRTSDCPTTRFSIPFTVTVTNPRRGPRMFHSKSHQRKLWHLQCSAGKTAEGRLQELPVHAHCACFAMIVFPTSTSTAAALSSSQCLHSAFESLQGSCRTLRQVPARASIQPRKRTGRCRESAPSSRTALRSR